MQWQRQGWRGKKLEELVKWWADSAFTWSVLALAAAEESACGLERRRSFGTIKSRIRPTYYLKAYQTTANMHPQTRGQNEGEGRGRGEVFIVAHGSGFGKDGTRLALEGVSDIFGHGGYDGKRPCWRVSARRRQ